MNKCCPICDAPLVPHEGDDMDQFNKRQTCGSRECIAKLKRRSVLERQAEAERAEAAAWPATVHFPSVKERRLVVKHCPPVTHVPYGGSASWAVR